MKHLLLFLFFLFTALCLEAQSDFLILRKKDITQKVFFEGQFVQFEIHGYGWVEGYLKKIRNDSVFINQMRTRQVANYWGLPSIDTMRLGISAFSIQNIKALPIQRKHESLFTNGTLLIFGSGGYILLNVLNGLIKNEAIFSGNNGRNLGIAAAVLAVGTLQIITRKDKILLGKKYTLYTTGTLQ